MTYEEIEAEVAQIIATSGRPSPVHARPVFAAFLQHTHGLQVIERCPYCQERLTVNGLTEQAWMVTCPCGLSQDLMRGL